MELRCPERADPHMVAQRCDADRTGFSLIELLLVVTIIGIIAAIVVPRVTTTTELTRDNVRASHITQMNQAIELYTFDNDAVPTALADLVPTYLPDGLPVDPDGGAYSFNATTSRVDYTP